MKYKCIKDYWMDNESSETGHTPAFAKGEIYEFYPYSGDDEEYLVTDTDHHKRPHYMDKTELDNSGYFELVKENTMTTMKWEEGKTYRFKPDMVEGFINLFAANLEIYHYIGDKSFTVKKLHESGKVYNLDKFARNYLEIDYWFDPDEIQYFELVEDTQVETPPQTSYEQDCVVEWFNKYYYVVENDSSVDDRLFLSAYSKQLVLGTVLTEIEGNVDVYKFIVDRYNLLQTQVKVKRKKELLDKQAELELELAKIKQELGE